MVSGVYHLNLETFFVLFLMMFMQNRSVRYQKFHFPGDSEISVNMVIGVCHLNLEPFLFLFFCQIVLCNIFTEIDLYVWMSGFDNSSFRPFCLKTLTLDRIFGVRDSGS